MVYQIDVIFKAKQCCFIPIELEIKWKTDILIKKIAYSLSATQI